MSVLILKSLRATAAASAAASILAGLPTSTLADEGGVSAYLPGTFGSLAATPLVPGLTWATIDIHSSVSAGGDVAAARTLNIGTRSANLTADLQANIKAQLDIVGVAPTYVFSDKILGAQLSVSLLAVYGRAIGQV